MARDLSVEGGALRSPARWLRPPVHWPVYRVGGQVYQLTPVTMLVDGGRLARLTRNFTAEGLQWEV
jgi:hypothetical protein